MKKILAAAVLPLLLAACASTGAPNGASATTAAAGNSMYCWKGRLSESGDKLVCNWAASATEACAETIHSDLPRSRVASGPANSRMCPNGQWLVQVTTR